MSKSKLSSITFALAFAGSAAAAAQPAPPLADSTAPPPAAAGEAATDNSPSTPSGKTDETKQPLSEKLKQSEGVIEAPTKVDPAIVKPAPDVNSKMPVIAPPGEKGGDQSVQPK